MAQETQPPTDGKFVRLKDWRRRLTDWVSVAERTPFRWGTFDCGLMAADAVKAITGTDPAEPVRGRYGSAEEALDILSDYAGKSGLTGSYEALSAFCDEHLGDHVHPNLARKGDVVLGGFQLRGEMAYTLMVDLGGNYLVAGGDGATQVRKQDVLAACAWRIG